MLNLCFFFPFVVSMGFWQLLDVLALTCELILFNLTVGSHYLSWLIMEIQNCGKPIDSLIEKVLCMNILSSDYFKKLFQLKTYHEVIDEIYNHVDHVEPWMTGNCRGPSSCYCLLYKCFTMKLTVKQMHGLLKHTDSPYIRAVCGGSYWLCCILLDILKLCVVIFEVHSCDVSVSVAAAYLHASWLNTSNCKVDNLVCNAWVRVQKGNLQLYEEQIKITCDYYCLFLEWIGALKFMLCIYIDWVPDFITLNLDCNLFLQ